LLPSAGHLSGQKIFAQRDLLSVTAKYFVISCLTKFGQKQQEIRHTAMSYNAHLRMKIEAEAWSGEVKEIEITAADKCVLLNWGMRITRCSLGKDYYLFIIIRPGRVIQKLSSPTVLHADETGYWD
jgi:hypothetical protein